MENLPKEPVGYWSVLMYANQLFAGLAGSNDIKRFAGALVKSPEILKIVAFLLLCVQKHGRMHPEDGCPTEWAKIYNCPGFTSTLTTDPDYNWIPKFNTI